MKPENTDKINKVLDVINIILDVILLSGFIKTILKNENNPRRCFEWGVVVLIKSK